MAQTSYIILSDEQKQLFYRSLQSGDRLGFGKVNKKTVFISRKKKKGLTQRSMLPQVASAWNALSPEENADWYASASPRYSNGYRLFVKDKCLRIVNDLAGNAIPSLLHQDLVGCLTISAPATAIKIVQLHPRSYWVSQKVYGKKGMYEPVIVTEDFALPLKISLNYSSDLVSVGGASYARFYAEVWSSYQGRDIKTFVQIDLDFQSDWKNAELQLDNVLGYVVGYDLYFELNDLQGNLYFDNVKSEHSGQNWCRDTYCDDINQGFTRAFFQIPKHWVALSLPVGSEYGSIYQDF
jgi:hypothetical protein